MKKLLFFLYLLGAVNLSMNATHISGGSISYQQISGDTFLLSLPIYRDCSGVNLSSNAWVDVNSSCYIPTSVSLNLQNLGGTEVSQLCPAALPNSTCNGGTLPGFELFMYSGIVLLNDTCDYTFSFSLCCRNPLVNIVGTANNYYIESEKMATPTINNSVVVNTSYLRYGCVNTAISGVINVSDPDNDSLYFELITPMIDTSNTVSYNGVGGYSSLNPLPGFVFDNNSGAYTINSPVLGNFAWAVRIYEYDRLTGTLKGSVVYDLEIIITNCANNMPTMSGIANAVGGVVNGNTLEVCNFDSVDFDIVVNDADTTDSVYAAVQTNLALIGLQATVSGSNPTTIRIFGHVNSYFVHNYIPIKAWDNACDIQGLTYNTIYLKVGEATQAGSNQTICGSQRAQFYTMGGSQFSWTVLSGSPIDTVASSPTYNATCNDCSNPQFFPSQTTVYVVTSNLNSLCGLNTDTVTVFVAPDFNILMPNDTIVCSSTDFQLGAPTDQPTYNYTYQWNNANTLNIDTVGQPIGQITEPQRYVVTVTSNLGCQKEDTMHVDVAGIFPSENRVVGDTVLCVGEQTTLQIELGELDYGNNGITNVDCFGYHQNSVSGAGTQLAHSGNLSLFHSPTAYGKYRMLFQAHELHTMGMPNGGILSSLSFLANSVTGVPIYDYYSIKIGYTNATSLTHNGIGISTMQEVFSSATFNVSTGWNLLVFDNPYKWNGVSNLIVEVCFAHPSSSISIPTNATITSFQSVHYSTNTNMQCNGYIQSNTYSSYRPNISFGFCSGVDSNQLQINWTPSGSVSQTNTMNVVASPGSSTNYTVVVSDSTGICIDTIHHFVDVVQQFDAGFMAATMCLNDSVQQFIPFVGGGYFTGNGVDSMGVFQPALAGAGVHPITYQISTPALCANDSTQMVNVIGLPDATIISDPVCNQSGPVNLQAATPGGKWSGPFITDTINGTFDPTGLFTGAYLVAYELSQPCYNADTTPIVVTTPIEFQTTVHEEICNNSTLDLSNSYSVFHAPLFDSTDLKVQWSDPLGRIDSFGVFDANGLSSGNVNVSVTLSLQDGSCANTENINVAVRHTDVPYFMESLTYCESDFAGIIYAHPFMFGHPGGLPNASFTQKPLPPLTALDTLQIGIYGVSYPAHGVFYPGSSPLGSWEIALTYTNTMGCSGTVIDSIHVLTAPQDSGIVSYQDGVAVTESNGLYEFQWYNCSDNSAIIGETGQELMSADPQGSYYCEITAGSCTIRTDCASIWPLGIPPLDHTGITLYPNPTTHSIIVHQSVPEPLRIKLMDLSGKTLKITHTQEAQTIFHVGHLVAGVYLIEIQTESDVRVHKIIKE